MPHFFAQSTLYSALTACPVRFNIDRDSTCAAHLGLVQRFVSLPCIAQFAAQWKTNIKQQNSTQDVSSGCDAFLRVATCHSSLCTGKNSKSQGAAPDALHKWVTGLQLDLPNATYLQRFFPVAPLRSSIRSVQAVVERLSLSCRMLFEENHRTLASANYFLNPSHQF